MCAAQENITERWRQTEWNQSVRAHTQNECCDTLERVHRWKFNLEFLSKRAQKPLSAGVHYSNAAAPRLSYIFFAFLPGPRHFSPPPPTIVIILNKERGGRRIAMEKLQPSTARLFQKEFSQQQQLLLSAGEKNECRGGECWFGVACFFFRMQIDACAAKTQGKIPPMCVLPARHQHHQCARRRHHIFFLIMCGGCKGRRHPRSSFGLQQPEVQYWALYTYACVLVGSGEYQNSVACLAAAGQINARVCFSFASVALVYGLSCCVLCSIYRRTMSEQEIEGAGIYLCAHPVCVPYAWLEGTCWGLRMFAFWNCGLRARSRGGFLGKTCGRSYLFLRTEGWTQTAVGGGGGRDLFEGARRIKENFDYSSEKSWKS